MVKASSETVFLFMEVIYWSVIHTRNHTFAKVFCVLQVFGFWCFFFVCDCWHEPSEISFTRI